jgi:restriction endonuclease Mrr
MLQLMADSADHRTADMVDLATTSALTDEECQQPVPRSEVREYVGQIEKKKVLIDAEQLAEYLFEIGIGVAEVTRYPIKRLDLDYFEEAE